MTGLMETLGLDKVDPDVNSLPDGKYDGIVDKDEYVHFPNKGTYNHVITYKVTEGEKKGRTKQEVFTIGKDPVFSEGGALESLTVTMNEDQKGWYTKRLTDLGVNHAQINEFKVGTLAKTPITFGVKTKDGWKNVSFAQKRNTEPQPTTVSENPAAVLSQPAQASTSSPVGDL